MSAPPLWIEVRVLAPEGWLELVADALTYGPCTSVAFGRPSLASDPAPAGFDYVRTFIPEHADGARLRAAIVERLASLAQRTEAPELERLHALFRTLPPEDYATSWKKSWKPFRVGRLCVLAPWSVQPPRASDLVLKLEPGGAFGSGRHATTRMCLRALERRIRGGERVLDAGTGSGILAVAAVMFGARAALGFDLDPNARPYALALARDNGVAERCEMLEGGFELLGPSRTGFDVVVANIYSDVIQAHAADIARCLRPEGWFALSGCPLQHAPPTVAAILAAGLAIEETLVRGRWHTFIGRRSI